MTILTDLSFGATARLQKRIMHRAQSARTAVDGNTTRRRRAPWKRTLRPAPPVAPRELPGHVFGPLQQHCTNHSTRVHRSGELRAAADAQATPLPYSLCRARASPVVMSAPPSVTGRSRRNNSACMPAFFVYISACASGVRPALSLAFGLAPTAANPPHKGRVERRRLAHHARSVPRRASTASVSPLLAATCKAVRPPHWYRPW